ncbi:hypothetical protein RB195_025311 [Necator americanus]|uniref:Metalloendopeptidase n=1 Tax=Necator americanus TaxID=51031 RepID=A0ABR1ERZ5_NECAM
MLCSHVREFQQLPRTLEILPLLRKNELLNCPGFYGDGTPISLTDAPKGCVVLFVEVADTGTNTHTTPVNWHAASYIGISIATPGCDVIGIISHEIGHALGIFHEQARPDQERHIAVNYNNIPISRWSNFNSFGPGQAETYGLPYDTGSVMHYGPFGFSSDPDKPTIRTLERIQQSTIGQRIGPSFLDYQAVSNKTRFINSANYPHGFKKGVECFWLLRAPREGRVFLEFAEPFEFLCEDTCDKSYVEVKYHSDKRLTGARYCCSSPPKERFISLDNELVVIMRGYVEGYRGFRAKFWSDVSEPILETTKYITSAIQTTPTSTRQATLPTTTETPKTTEDLLAIPKISFTDKTVEPTHRWSEKPFTLTSTRRNTPKTGTKTWGNRHTIGPLRTTSTRNTSLLTLVATTTQLPTRRTSPQITSLSTTTIHSTMITSRSSGKEECDCRSWSEWVGECAQPCGGCGHRVRTRQCHKANCRNEEKRTCNFSACPSGTNFLINNGEFHILWRGCCVGLFRSEDECTTLDTDENPFLRLITSFLSIQDIQDIHRSDIRMKIPEKRHQNTN